MKKVILSVLAIASLMITSCSDHLAKSDKDSESRPISFLSIKKVKTPSSSSDSNVRVSQGTYALETPITISTGAIYLWR